MKNCFLSSILSKRRRKAKETFPVVSIAVSKCQKYQLREQSEPFVFISQVSEALHVQYIFFSLTPPQRAMGISANRHWHCGAQRAQLMWGLEAWRS